MVAYPVSHSPELRAGKGKERGGTMEKGKENTNHHLEKAQTNHTMKPLLKKVIDKKQISFEREQFHFTNEIFSHSSSFSPLELDQKDI